MDGAPSTPLRIGDWLVNPLSGQISRAGESIRVEARTMRLLLVLAERAGAVVSIEELLNQVWSGVIVTPDSVYQAVASLRRLLGDDPKSPRYIATVPRLGYRMVATVDKRLDEAATPPPPPASPQTEMQPPPPAAAAQARPRRATRALLAAAAVLLAGLAAYALLRPHATTPVAAVTAGTPHHGKSVAVLPFLDLTEGMKEELFADGMTEELIDKLSQVPGLQVPAPTSSFYFKDKQITIAEVARSLGVAYVLDGSVRKSGDMLRVAVRLVRADDGFVIWSETYDRPLDDKLMVQDDIAGEVAKALRTSIN